MRVDENKLLGLYPRKSALYCVYGRLRAAWLGARGDGLLPSAEEWGSITDAGRMVVCEPFRILEGMVKG